jgi:hypothetical protein
MIADKSVATASRQQVVIETAYLRAFGRCSHSCLLRSPPGLLPSGADFLTKHGRGK